MGARRISRQLRDQLTGLVQDSIELCREQTGAIDSDRLTEHVLASLASELDGATLRDLRTEAVTMAIDSLVADVLRDKRRRMVVAGRLVKIREVYRIPQEGGTWAIKTLGELTEEDIDRLEAYYEREAMGRLRTARALRQIRGFVHEPKAQFELERVQP